MSEIFFTDTILYPVGSSVELRLVITIGEGQAGSSDATLDGATVDVHDQGNDQELVVRCPGGMRQRVMTVQTRVRDVNPATDRTSVRHQLRGGEALSDRTFKVSAPTGGRAIYTVAYVLL